MTRFFTDRVPQSRSRMGYWALALVCLALLALLTTVQVTHLHAQANDADHCALCIAMHTAAPVAAAAGLVLLVRMQGLTPAAEVRAIARRRASRHTTRPPPYGY